MDVQLPPPPSLSPVLALPHEITSEIFIHFLQTCPAIPPPSGFPSPTSLTHVCRQWRHIALAMPALWRAIEFDINCLTYAQLLRIWDAWTERSGSGLVRGLAISRRIRLYKTFMESSALDNPARWEHLTLRTAFLAGIPRPLPALRLLDLFSASAEGNDFAFEAVPQLLTVVLQGHVIPKVQLPWTQLTCLTLIDSSNLVQCALRFNNDPFYSFLDNTRLNLTLPHLESLLLESIPASESVVDELLLSFRTPSLTRLDSEEVFLSAEPILALQWFILKSGCRLQEVRIRGESKISCEEYRAAFPSIPTFILASDDSEGEL
ncbi:hypothetical protein C8R45DRAFT_1097345 [Mycena sanguinolenta]|nr:hypothetical protein C8R45DRAFT_1097345 [Mycena sanguinolenta]